MQVVVNEEMLMSQYFQQQCSVEYSTADVRIYKCLLYHRLRDHDGKGGGEKPEDGEEHCKMPSVLWEGLLR